MKRAPFIHIYLLIAFIFNSIGPISLVQADEFRLPQPGVMVHLSPPLDPPILKGIKVHPDNPFKFDFILDKGDSSYSKQEATKLIKYFLASLTIPEKDLWVNLSPYEKNRIIPQSFGLTEMGRDLLAEDYMLKQITASLIYPEDAIGQKFWKRIYQEAQKKFGTTNIPVNTFNKVWIVPEKAVIYENAKAGTAYVVEAKLKVMLEQDYLSLEKHSTALPSTTRNDISSIGANIIREIVIPELTRDVNENKNFAQLRQVYNSLILATWYKKKIRDSILEQVYADKNKVKGLSFPNTSIGNPEHIYQRYLQAFRKGVFNYIKEDLNPTTQEIIPRKYFSGGFSSLNLSKIESDANPLKAKVVIDQEMSSDRALLIESQVIIPKEERKAIEVDRMMKAEQRVRVRSVMEANYIPLFFAPSDQQDHFMQEKALVAKMEKLDPSLASLLGQLYRMRHNDNQNLFLLLEQEFNKVLRPYDLYVCAQEQGDVLGFLLYDISEKKQAVLIDKSKQKRFETPVLFAKIFGKYPISKFEAALFHPMTKDVVVFPATDEDTISIVLETLFLPNKNVADEFYKLDRNPVEVTRFFHLLAPADQKRINDLIGPIHKSLMNYNSRFANESITLGQALDREHWSELIGRSSPTAQAELYSFLDSINLQVQEVIGILEYALPGLRDRINRALDEPVKKIMMADLREHLSVEEIDDLRNYYLMLSNQQEIKILINSLAQKVGSSEVLREDLLPDLIEQSIRLNHQHGDLIPGFEPKIRQAVAVFDQLSKKVDENECQRLISRLGKLETDSRIGHEVIHAYLDFNNISQNMEGADEENFVKAVQIRSFSYFPRIEMSNEMLNALIYPEDHYDVGRQKVLNYYAEEHSLEEDEVNTPEGLAHNVLPYLGASPKNAREFYAGFLADRKVWGDKAVNPDNFELQVEDVSMFSAQGEKYKADIDFLSKVEHQWQQVLRNSQDRNLDVLHAAIILAHAQYILRFSSGQLTSFHQSKIAHITMEELNGLLDEDREAIYRLMGKYFKHHEVSRIKVYEEKFRIEVRKRLEQLERNKVTIDGWNEDNWNFNPVVREQKVRDIVAFPIQRREFKWSAWAKRASIAALMLGGILGVKQYLHFTPDWGEGFFDSAPQTAYKYVPEGSQTNHQASTIKPNEWATVGHGEGFSIHTDGEHAREISSLEEGNKPKIFKTDKAHRLADGTLLINGIYSAVDGNNVVAEDNNVRLLPGPNLYNPNNPTNVNATVHYPAVNKGDKIQPYLLWNYMMTNVSDLGHVFTVSNDGKSLIANTNSQGGEISYVLYPSTWQIVHPLGLTPRETQEIEALKTNPHFKDLMNRIQGQSSEVIEQEAESFIHEKVKYNPFYNVVLGKEMLANFMGNAFDKDGVVRLKCDEIAYFVYLLMRSQGHDCVILTGDVVHDQDVDGTVRGSGVEHAVINYLGSDHQWKLADPTQASVTEENLNLSKKIDLDEAYRIWGHLNEYIPDLQRQAFYLIFELGDRNVLWKAYAADPSMNISGLGELLGYDFDYPGNDSLALNLWRRESGEYKLSAQGVSWFKQNVLAGKLNAQASISAIHEAWYLFYAVELFQVKDQIVSYTEALINQGHLDDESFKEGIETLLRHGSADILSKNNLSRIATLPKGSLMLDSSAAEILLQAVINKPTINLGILHVIDNSREILNDLLNKLILRGGDTTLFYDFANQMNVPANAPVVREFVSNSLDTLKTIALSIKAPYGEPSELYKWDVYELLVRCSGDPKVKKALDEITASFSPDKVIEISSSGKAIHILSKDMVDAIINQKSTDELYIVKPSQLQTKPIIIEPMPDQERQAILKDMHSIRQRLEFSYHPERPRQGMEEILYKGIGISQGKDQMMDTTAPLPLEFTMDLNKVRIIGYSENAKYPIFRLGNRVFFQKVRPSKFVYSARFGYQMAHAIGFEGVNNVQIYSTKEGDLDNIEDYWGEDLSILPDETRNKKALFFALGISQNSNIRDYQAFVRMFGASLVRGDIYRIFSNHHGDSNEVRNLRVMPLGKKFAIRWVDYDDSFALGKFYNNLIVPYLQARTEFILKYGIDLVENIVGLRDIDIEHIADHVYGSEGILLLARAERLPLETARGRLQTYRQELVEEVKIRRDKFGIFYKWLLEKHKIPLNAHSATLALRALDEQNNDNEMKAEVKDRAMTGIVEAMQARGLKWKEVHHYDDGTVEADDENERVVWAAVKFNDKYLEVFRGSGLSHPSLYQIWLNKFRIDEQFIIASGWGSGFLWDVENNKLKLSVLHIEETFQGQGVGLVLLQWLKNYAKRRNIVNYANLATLNPRMLYMHWRMLKPETVRFYINDKEFEQETFAQERIAQEEFTQEELLPHMVEGIRFGKMVHKVIREYPARIFFETGKDGIFNVRLGNERCAYLGYDATTHTATYSVSDGVLGNIKIQITDKIYVKVFSPQGERYAVEFGDGVQIKGEFDFGMKAKATSGGIDLTLANSVLQTKSNIGEIKFHLDAAMLAQLKNAPGFVPVIINAKPLKDLSGFLGLTPSLTNSML